jgi:hypothetical protein
MIACKCLPSLTQGIFSSSKVAEEEDDDGNMVHQSMLTDSSYFVLQTVLYQKATL